MRTKIVAFLLWSICHALGKLQLTLIVFFGVIESLGE